MSVGESFSLGIDVGTTRIKAEVVGLDASELHCESALTPWQQRAASTQADLDELADVAIAVAAVAADWAQAQGQKVVSIGVTGMAETGALIDAHSRPLAAALAWHQTLGDPVGCRRHWAVSTSCSPRGGTARSPRPSASSTCCASGACLVEAAAGAFHRDQFAQPVGLLLGRQVEPGVSRIQVRAAAFAVGEPADLNLTEHGRRRAGMTDLHGPVPHRLGVHDQAQPGLIAGAQFQVVGEQLAEQLP